MEEELGNYKSVRLMVVTGKIMDESFPALIAKCMKNRTVKQHVDIYKGKLCLISLIIFYSEMPGLVDKGKAVDVIIYSDFSIVLGTVSVMPL